MNEPHLPENLASDVESAAHSAREALEQKKKEFTESTTTAWLPFVIGGSALLITIGYMLGRRYLPHEFGGPRNERFLRELQEWFEEQGSSLPQSLKKRLTATGEFIGDSLKQVPIPGLKLRKKRGFFDLF